MFIGLSSRVGATLVESPMIQESVTSRNRIVAPVGHGCDASRRDRVAFSPIRQKQSPAEAGLCLGGVRSSLQQDRALRRLLLPLSSPPSR